MFGIQKAIRAAVQKMPAVMQAQWASRCIESGVLGTNNAVYIQPFKLAQAFAGTLPPLARSLIARGAVNEIAGNNILRERLLDMVSRHDTRANAYTADSLFDQICAESFRTASFRIEDSGDLHANISARVLLQIGEEIHHAEFPTLYQSRNSRGFTIPEDMVGGLTPMDFATSQRQALLKAYLGHSHPHWAARALVVEGLRTLHDPVVISTYGR